MEEGHSFHGRGEVTLVILDSILVCEFCITYELSM